MDHRYRQPPRRPPGAAGGGRDTHGEHDEGEAQRDPYAQGGRPAYAPEHYAGPEDPQTSGDDAPGHEHTGYDYRPARQGQKAAARRDEQEYGRGAHQAGYGRDQEYGDYLGRDFSGRSGAPVDPGNPDAGDRRSTYRGVGTGAAYAGYARTRHPRHWGPATGGPDWQHAGSYGPSRAVEEPGAGHTSQRPRRLPKGYVRSDERIREDICEKLMADETVEVGDVSIEVQNGGVRLEGFVPERPMKHRIEDIACACLGVRDVDNHIRVGSGAEVATVAPTAYGAHSPARERED